VETRTANGRPVEWSARAMTPGWCLLLNKSRGLQRITVQHAQGQNVHVWIQNQVAYEPGQFVGDVPK